MRDDDAPHGMWRELRSWPLYAQIGAGAVATGSVVLAFAIPAIAEPDFPDESAWPEGELPEAAALAEVPEAAETDEMEEAGLPAEVSVYDGEPLWSYRLDEESGSVAHVDQGTLVRYDGSLSLVADGETVWEHTWEEYGPEIGVAGEVLIISTDIEDDESWPGTRETVAFDLDTGEEVWRDEEASFVTVFSDAVLMTECTGGQDDHIGDCTLYARDPVDLSTRWSTPTYASARVISSNVWSGEPVPDPLRIESFPTGHESRTVSVIDGDGGVLARVRTQDGTVVAMPQRMLVAYDDYDENPADDCTATLKGYRFGEDDPAWEIEADMRKSADLASCGDLPDPTVRDGRLPLTVDGFPVVVDVATGEVDWTAPDQGQGYALSEDAGALVAVDWEKEEENLVAYDVASGEVLWRATARVSLSVDASAVGSTLWIYGDPGMWGGSSLHVIAYDLDSGEGVVLPGGVNSFVPGQIVMSERDDDTAELTAWPVDLWS